jgi:cyclopropane fatty-acyl-phospholipid synthase-like methyltransferase
MGSFNSLVKYLQGIGKATKFKQLKLVAKDYALQEDSLFFDLGSGLGKPCYHMAFEVGCQSFGLEMERVR